MKVSRDQTYHPCNPNSEFNYRGMPIRLEIAKTLLAGLSISEKSSDKDLKDRAAIAVKAARYLIDAYNQDVAE